MLLSVRVRDDRSGPGLWHALANNSTAKNAIVSEDTKESHYKSALTYISTAKIDIVSQSP